MEASACLSWQPLSPGYNSGDDGCQLQGQELSFCYLWVQCCALTGSGPPWWLLDLAAVQTAAALNLKRLLQTKVCGQACTDESGCPSLALWAGFPKKLCVLAAREVMPTCCSQMGCPGCVDVEVLLADHSVPCVLMCT